MNSRGGYVYLLRSENGYYKIGHTVDPKNRIKTFSVKLPFDVAYEHLIGCDNRLALEAALHQRYDHRRVRGEWFALTDQDVEEIKSMAQIEAVGLNFYRTCEGCEKPMRLENRTSRRQYHNAVCRKRAQRRREREARGPRRRSVPVMVYAGICAFCGEQMFSSRPTTKEYCSPGCRQAAYRQRKSEQGYQVVVEERE